MCVCVCVCRIDAVPLTENVCVFPDKSFPRAVVTPEDQVVMRNEEAAFHCQFTAEPAPTVQWYHDTELLANKSRYATEPWPTLA